MKASRHQKQAQEFTDRFMALDFSSAGFITVSQKI